MKALAVEDHPNGLHLKVNVISLLVTTISNISVPGGATCVEAAGEGPLAVCSPAIEDNRDAFAPFSCRLVKTGFWVANADLRGHGDSSTGFDSHDNEPTAQDMLAIVDELGGGSAILAGAPMSAAAAIVATGKEPGRASGLILFGPLLRDAPDPFTWLGFRFALARLRGPVIWCLYLCRLWPDLGDQALARASCPFSILKGKSHWTVFSKTARIDHTVVAPWFSCVTAPALVVMGAEDPDWKDPRVEAS